MSDYLRFRDGFAQALNSDLYPIGYLDALIAQRRALLWAGNKAAIVAEIRHYPTGLYDIHGLVATGDLEEITSCLIPAAETFARDVGCSGAIIESREGWKRQLRGLGYEPFQVSLRKVL